MVTQSKHNEEFRQQNQIMSDAIQQLTSKVESLVTHNKILETQIAQQASSSSRPKGMFPGKPATSPHEQYKAITLRNGKQMEEPKIRKEDVPRNETEEVKAPLPHMRRLITRVKLRTMEKRAQVHSLKALHATNSFSSKTS